MNVLSLVERGGDVRFVRLDAVTVPDVAEVVNKNVSRETRLVTDEARTAGRSARPLPSTRASITLGTSGRGVTFAWTRWKATSTCSRGGMHDAYQHCREKHLYRYLAEFDFRYNNRVAKGVSDETRTIAALAGIVGRRLTYRDS
jgi:hypothetical protein